MGMRMIQTSLRQFAMFLAIAVTALTVHPAYAEDKAPDVVIKSLLSDFQDTIKNDKDIQGGDTAKVVSLVNSLIMPNVDFERMTAAAVGPPWGQASPQQQKRIQEEFKILLVRVYAGAMARLKDQTISMKPFKAAAEDKEVLVRAEVKGARDTIQLDYKMEKTPGQGAGWRIYNLKVLGVWLVESYRSQFAQEISTKGVDGLIAALSDLNKANSKKS